MITFTYEEKDARQGIQQHVAELEACLSNFINLNDSQREDYLSTTYAEKIIAIASLIDELTPEHNKQLSHDSSALKRLAKRSGNHDNFDPRYVQEFKGTWAEKPNVNAKINQKLEDIASALDILPTKRARFILWNSIKYLAGKDSDKYTARVEQFNKSNIEELIKLSEKPFDYAEAPFEAKMNGFCTPVAKNGKVHGLFSREQFELFLLQQQAYAHMESFARAADGIEYFNPADLNEKLSEKFKFSIRGVYSDGALEQFEHSIDERLFSSLFINYAFKNAVKTKTSLKLNGKGRDLFLSDSVFLGGKISIEDAGDWALGYAGITDCDIKIEKAGDWALEYATIKDRDIKIDNVGDSALGDAKMNGGFLNVGGVGNNFGIGADILVDRYEFGKDCAFTGRINVGEEAEINGVYRQ